VAWRGTKKTTTTSGVGKLIFHMFAALAEFEKDLIRERTMAGLASATLNIGKITFYRYINESKKDRSIRKKDESE